MSSAAFKAILTAHALSPSLDESAADPGATKKASKPRKKHSHRTIEQNVSALNICEADRKCEVRRGAQCGMDSLGPAGQPAASAAQVSWESDRRLFLRFHPPAFSEGCRGKSLLSLNVLE